MMYSCLYCGNLTLRVTTTNTAYHDLYLQTGKLVCVQPVQDESTTIVCQNCGADYSDEYVADWENGRCEVIKQ